jgi:hypothetical protein
VKVKDILEAIKEMDPETELTIDPVTSYVLRPVGVKEDDVEKGNEE